MFNSTLQAILPRTYRVLMQSIRSYKNNIESDSEKWIRLAAHWSDKDNKFGTDSESDAIKGYESGRLSTFEDDEGNPLYPTGLLTNAKPLKPHKYRSSHTRKNKFVDTKNVKFTAGHGGSGEISFLRLFMNPMAGPDGGDGGNGGHIILKADDRVKSLSDLQSTYHGNNGEDGANKDLTGKCGKHIIIDVPVGTLIKEQSGKILIELAKDGEMFIAARGGAGGKGNHFFLTNENRHPRVAEYGGRGETRQLILEMRCFAHAGLIGFPNVGKSTLLRAISRATPMVADYPFTTLVPHIGVIEYSDYEQIAVADLPGLIEGAHENQGLGHDFLKHVEKCVCLFYVIDISLPEPWKQLEALKYELEQYKMGLSKRPHCIIASKYDSEDLLHKLDELKSYIAENTVKDEIPLPVIPVSGKYGYNLTEFLKHLRALYDLYNKPEPDEEGFKW
ncbi:mitochondrial ribosome-associated GTPase 2 [Tetranychus urticae]|uniref:OBG-type G domain-containing protein n=1 Tax=Tetranychus urticae TaxID=32264 RepID=T1KWP5_TETUR|nr:mitochondrial ribosome-associated GTPase 2 [Tetranychus urticae]